MNILFDDLPQVDAGLGTLDGRPGIPPEYLVFRCRLHKVQSDAFRSLLDLSKDEEAVRRELSGGINSVLKHFYRNGGGNLLDISEAVAADPSGLGAAVMLERNIAGAESLAGPLKVSADAVIFLGRLLRAPFSSHGAAISSKEPDRTAKPGCPWCGSAPGLAILSASDGRRALACGECGMEWDFPRFLCPHCGSDKEIGVLKEGRDDPRWLETCESCRMAIKVVDARLIDDSKRPIPLVESVAGMYLDLIAEGHEYSTGTPYAAIR